MPWLPILIPRFISTNKAYNIFCFRALIPLAYYNGGQNISAIFDILKEKIRNFQKLKKLALFLLIHVLKYIQLFIQILQKFWRHCSQKEKFIKNLLAFVILMFWLGQNQFNFLVYGKDRKIWIMRIIFRLILKKQKIID